MLLLFLTFLFHTSALSPLVVHGTHMTTSQNFLRQRTGSTTGGYERVLKDGNWLSSWTGEQHNGENHWWSSFREGGNSGKSGDSWWSGWAEEAAKQRNDNESGDGENGGWSWVRNKFASSSGQGDHNSASQSGDENGGGGWNWGWGANALQYDASSTSSSGTDSESVVAWYTWPLTFLGVSIGVCVAAFLLLRRKTRVALGKNSEKDAPQTDYEKYEDRENRQ